MSEVRVGLNNIRCPDWYPKGRKISRHSRKLNGDTFVAPRIILPPEYNDLYVHRELWTQAPRIPVWSQLIRSSV